ncbi:hypothetical protein [Subtercola endophyticus]|uniref:hypothetical protein n=1 Tax=Subtercola endophyticus TaxID=2895559 RepID=UPI001E52EAD1|nr:hypothetical protein [Subtercola endophyticus]UFS60238.1 hypothetical protein LQ955_05640 [Subtercola endophyticus]
MKRKTGRFVASLASAVLIGAALLMAGASGAQAAPLCSGPDAPSACHPKPPAPPPRPNDLESQPFTPTPGVYNVIDVAMGVVTPAAVQGYAKGDDTPYRVSISCTNGYFFSHSMTMSDPGTLRYTIVIPPDAAAGACYGATWDQSTLGLYTVNVYLEERKTKTFDDWHVDFNP